MKETQARARSHELVYLASWHVYFKSNSMIFSISKMKVGSPGVQTKAILKATSNLLADLTNATIARSLNKSP